MNEITRIHIAKVAYDVEVTAKKHLEKYIKSLEAYTRDAEVLGDIEIRITELLSERGVKAGGVISTADVAAVREQLGEPYEFADEDGDIAVGKVEEHDGRKFFRSVDDAVLGGVLSGIATYFKVNPMWTRLVFVLVLFISFGLAALAYILLWIIVPPARSATEKLRQAGRPVTLESIRELNVSEDGSPRNRIAPVVKRTAGLILGILSLMAALGVLTFSVFAVFGLVGADINAVSDRLGFSFAAADSSMAATAWVVTGIVIFGLLLLAALFSLVAYAFIARKLTKRMIVSGIVIIAFGLASFASSIAIVATQAWRVSSEAQSLMKTTKVSLPKEFSTVTDVTIETVNSKDENNTYVGYPAIQYIVDEGAPRYELSALPGVKPVVKIDGNRAVLTLNVPSDYRNTFVQASLIVYGPALTDITNRANNVNYTGVTQDALNVSTENWSNLSINGGSIETLTVRGKGVVDVSSASVVTLAVTSEQGLRVSAGTVRELTVTQPDVCPSGQSAQSSVDVSGITSSKMTYNGTERAATTYRTSCAEVIVGQDNDYDY